MWSVSKSENSILPISTKALCQHWLKECQFLFFFSSFFSRFAFLVLMILISIKCYALWTHTHIYMMWQKHEQWGWYKSAFVAINLNQIYTQRKMFENEFNSMWFIVLSFTVSLRLENELFFSNWNIRAHTNTRARVNARNTITTHS